MKFIILFLLLTPNLSFGCFAGPQPAPGYELDFVPYITDYVNGNNEADIQVVTDSKRDELVWEEMGYLDIAPSGWGEVKNISNKYYSLQVIQGGVGSCGPESLYIHKKFLLASVSILIFFILLRFVYSKHIKKVEYTRSQIIANLIIPIAVLLSVILLLNIISSVSIAKKEYERARVQQEFQLNYDSYETGKRLQHAIEESIYQGGEYREMFPKTLDELVELNLIESIPASPFTNLPYTYTRDANGKNYTICFPQTEGERCERSWSRGNKL